MTITPSQEDYLEAIYNLALEKDFVRITDIADSLGIAKSSAHVAMHALKDREFILQEHYGQIKLTPLGETTAKQVRDKHTALLEFLTAVLGVEEARAQEEACKIEHVISDSTVEKIALFTRQFRK